MTHDLPTIDQIIEQLARHRQRATYGALAGVVGGLARSVMGRHPRTQRNSWVVSASTGLPTAYLPQDIDLQLLSRSHVITSADELRQWLEQGVRVGVEPRRGLVASTRR